MSKYIDRASCKHLTHKYASFHGCTLGEMFVLTGLYAGIELPIVGVLAAFIGPYVGGYWGGFLLLLLAFSMVGFFLVVPKAASRVGMIRKGRPAGYLKLRFRQLCHQKFGLSIIYVCRNGSWSTRRKIS